MPRSPARGPPGHTCGPVQSLDKPGVSQACPQVPPSCLRACQYPRDVSGGQDRHAQDGLDGVALASWATRSRTSTDASCGRATRWIARVCGAPRCPHDRRGRARLGGALSRSFRAVFGETPHRYLQRRRVERSMFLLRETDRSVTDICFDVGFSSLGTFSRTLQIVEGSLHRSTGRRTIRSPHPIVSRCWRCAWWPHQPSTNRAVLEKPRKARWRRSVRVVRIPQGGNDDERSDEVDQANVRECEGQQGLQRRRTGRDGRAREGVEGREAPRGRQAGWQKRMRSQIAEMPPSDRAMAERFHALVKDVAPALSPKTWYGMPAYASRKARSSASSRLLSSTSATRRSASTDGEPR